MFDTFWFFQTSHESNSIVWFVLFVETIYAFGFLFVVCELCQRLTNEFDKVDEMINGIDWFSFPMEIQRLMPTFIGISWQPIEIKVFGSITNSRETFKQVSLIQSVFFWPDLIIAAMKFSIGFKIINKAFSYFMVFQQFYDWTGGDSLNTGFYFG